MSSWVDSEKSDRLLLVHFKASERKPMDHGQQTRLRQAERKSDIRAAVSNAASDERNIHTLLVPGHFTGRLSSE